MRRIGIRSKQQLPQAKKLCDSIRKNLALSLESLSMIRCYTIEWDLDRNATASLLDPLLEAPCDPDQPDEPYDWKVEIGFKPGVTDNSGMTARTAIEDFLQTPLLPENMVRSSITYLLKGTLLLQEVEKMAENFFANKLIQTISIEKKGEEKKQNRCNAPVCQTPKVERISLLITDDKLLELSRKRCLALTLEEMKTIQKTFPQITDVELEALAQTWSEHCKHKIFNARIHYTCNGNKETIDSIFSTYIKRATKLLHSDWLVSVFTDNAGIIDFDGKWDLCFKVETHNSPSALDPYGGALTGILGVNRDIMGAGRGARLVANTDVFCFAPPNFSGTLPPRLLHPKRVFEGVRLGVEHGGNKSGVPTVNGAIVFDERYLGKPLVFCGSVGIAKKGGENKTILPGDLVVIAGGKTGKDGIHGATFSSEGLHEQSPTTAVQIGDPFTQKKVHDFLLEANENSLYRTLTDNGAGGFSSSCGELALLSGGCRLHLEKAPLKYPGLAPWEILVSESQERMTLAVPADKWPALQKIAAIHEVELACIGTFTNDDNFHILMHGETVGCLPLEFLHNAVPKMELEAFWEDPQETPLLLPDLDPVKTLHQLLSRYNIASKESIVCQYDHEVQGGTVIKPLAADAAVVRPLECFDGDAAFTLANGICPRFSDYDTYHMALNAVDEAVRGSIAVGADPNRIAILDNFCWPDPVGCPHKTAQLVRACQGLFDGAIAFKTPIISGKDSMKNDYKMGEVVISVPPTLLVSALGKMKDLTKAVTLGFKKQGDEIFLIGETKNELGGSELAALVGLVGGSVPKVDLELAPKIYKKMHEAIENELFASCHDLSKGGLAVALAKCAIASGLGAIITLPDNSLEFLFSESPSRFIVSTDQPQKVQKLFTGLPITHLGKVGGNYLFEENVEALKKSYTEPLKDF